MSPRFSTSDTKTDARCQYECLSCGRRVKSDHALGVCPNCGGELQNLSVERQL